MKKEEKELLFNLLKTADANAYGYQRNCFSVMPDFSDDTAEKKSAELQTSDDSKVSVESQTSDETQTAKVSQISVESQLSDKFQTSVESQKQTETTNLTISQLNDKIIRCTRCSLARTRNNVITGIGVENPEVLVIGEWPSYEDDIQGKTFSGKTGILLDKMLNAIDIDKNKNCYITNIIKCFPPDNRNPFDDEISACFSFLEAQIHVLKPKMILCLGYLSAKKLLNLEMPMNDIRGKFFEYNNIPVMVTYAPKTLLINEQLKRPAWEDLKNFKRKLQNIPNI